MLLVEYNNTIGYLLTPYLLLIETRLVLAWVVRFNSSVDIYLIYFHAGSNHKYKLQCRVHEMHNILTNLLQLTHGEYENQFIGLQFFSLDKSQLVKKTCCCIIQ